MAFRLPKSCRSARPSAVQLRYSPPRGNSPRGNSLLGPISLLRLSRLRLLDSNFPENSLWT